MTSRHLHKKWKRQRTAGKDEVVRLLSSLLTNTIFNGCVRTINFKMTCVRVILYKYVPGVQKFCSPECVMQSKIEIVKSLKLK